MKSFIACIVPAESVWVVSIGDDRNQLYNMISVSGDAVVVIEDPNAEATDGTRAGESVPH